MVMRRPFTPAKKRRGAVLFLRIRHGEQSCFHGEITTVENRSRGDYYRATTLTTCEKGPWSTWDPTGEGLGECFSSLSTLEGSL
jgi:hypothetical protein